MIRRHVGIHRRPFGIADVFVFVLRCSVWKDDDGKSKLRVLRTRYILDIIPYHCCFYSQLPLTGYVIWICS